MKKKENERTKLKINLKQEKTKNKNRGDLIRRLLDINKIYCEVNRRTITEKSRKPRKKVRRIEFPDKKKNERKTRNEQSSNREEREKEKESH
jgi:hypothetical protein